MFVNKLVLTDRITRALSLASDTSVSTYTVPDVKQEIDQAFLTIFRKRFWPHLTFITEHTLSFTEYETTLNQFLLPSANIWEAQDIEWIKASATGQTLPRMKIGQHLVDQQPGYEITDPGVNNNLVLTVYPNGYTDKVFISARRIPTLSLADYTETGALFGDQDVVPFDEVALLHLVVANLFAKDESNPTAQARHDQMFEQRYTDLISQESSDVSVFSTRRPATSFTVLGS